MVVAKIEVVGHPSTPFGHNDRPTPNDEQITRVGRIIASASRGIGDVAAEATHRMIAPLDLGRPVIVASVAGARQKGIRLCKVDNVEVHLAAWRYGRMKVWRLPSGD
jgi:hypothetical protein